MSTSSDMSHLELESSWGCIRVSARDSRICGCELPALQAEPAQKLTFKKAKLRLASATDERVLRQADAFIQALFSGKKAALPPYHWPSASPFTNRVWKQLTDLDAGTITTYGALAKKIGRPGGARAVGRACGANPLPLFIPCHRVIPRDGSLGGFSSGLPWKRLLLDLERGRSG